MHLQVAYQRTATAAALEAQGWLNLSSSNITTDSINRPLPLSDSIIRPPPPLPPVYPPSQHTALPGLPACFGPHQCRHAPAFCCQRRAAAALRPGARHRRRAAGQRTRVGVRRGRRCRGAGAQKAGRVPGAVHLQGLRSRREELTWVDGDVAGRELCSTVTLHSRQC